MSMLKVIGTDEMRLSDSELNRIQKIIGLRPAHLKNKKDLDNYIAAHQSQFPEEIAETKVLRHLLGVVIEETKT